MMNREPIKRSFEIVPLSQEHHYSLLFSWKIKQGLEKGIEASRILKYVKYFWEHHLQQHFKKEQLILFSAVEGAALVEKTIKAQNEAASDILSLLSDKVSEEGQKALLLTLADKMTELVREEERSLFPELEKLLTQKELEGIEEKIRKMQPEHLKDDYPDAFWGTEKQQS